MEDHWEQPGAVDRRTQPARDDSPGLPVTGAVQHQAPAGDAGASQRAGWEGELLDDVIRRFMDEIPGFIDRLQEALQARDMPFLRATAYHLRGTTGLLQAHALSGLARDLEDCARAEDIVCACRVANVLVQELQNLMDVLEDLA